MTKSAAPRPSTIPTPHFNSSWGSKKNSSVYGSFGKPLLIGADMDTFKVPLIIRGEIIEDYELEFGNRAGSGSGFVTPDVSKYIRKLVNNDPASLLDLYSISLEDIYSYLEELGNRLNFDKNAGLREAFEVSCHFSNLSRPSLDT